MLGKKSQIQALEQTQRCLPLKPGRAGRWTHNSKRHGTTILFAAFHAWDGTVISLCQQRHRHQQWMKILRLVDEATPAA